MAQLRRAFGARSAVRTIWRVGLFSNLPLCLVIALSFVLQLAIHHVPTLQQLLGTTPISLGQYGVWIMLGAVPFVVLEVWKLFPQARRVGHAGGM